MHTLSLHDALPIEDSGPTWTQVSPHLDLVTLLFWLIYDRRLRLGSRHCHDCNETDRVCLGRAWLFTGLDRRDRTFCFIGWLDTAEIGRAACRERVCKYVEIPVVAVSLKKKTRKD